MHKMVIVQSEMRSGRGARGRNLHRFLATFHGRRNVSMLTVDHLRRRRQVSADWLFIGVPTSLDKECLCGVRYRNAVLFDYRDEPGPCWVESDQRFLRSLTDLYLKPWVEPDWDHGLRFGVLPIRRYQELVWALRTLRLLGRSPPALSERRYDVAFIGNCTSPDKSNLRVRWLREIKRAEPAYSFWGGIAASKADEKRLREKIDDVDDLLYPRRRIGFVSYFRHLRDTRVALTPAGNAPWSYRHWEAIYAGAILVSTDFRQIRTLLPLPLERMIHVPKSDSILSALERALALGRDQPDLVEENIRFLERYLQDSDYSRNKPALMDLFMDQLERPLLPA